MRRFVIDTLRFSIYTLCLIIVGIIVWGQLVPAHYQQNLLYVVGSGGHLHSKLSELRDVQHVDVVVLGSSTALTGFDPRIFEEHGLILFNLGSAMQTPVQTELLVERYIDVLNPELVIFDTYPGAFGSQGEESALSLLANDHIGLDSLVMALRVNNMSVYTTMVFSFWRQFAGLDAGYVEEVEKSGTTYVSGGYVERPVSRLEPKSTYPEREWIFRKKQRDAFLRTIDALLARGIDVILVRSPIAVGYYDSFSNNGDIDRYFRETELPYYNVNENIHLGDEYFFDEVHLNQDGVEVMNSWIINQLRCD